MLLKKIIRATMNTHHFYRGTAQKRVFPHLPVEQGFLKGLIYASVSEKTMNAVSYQSKLQIPSTALQDNTDTRISD